MKHPFLLTALLLTACAPAHAPAPVAVPAALTVAAAAPVTVVGRLGLLAASGKRVLSDDLTAWAASDVDLVVLSVKRNGVEAIPDVRLEGAAISQTFRLSPLVAGATYAVVGRAYRAGVAIDDYDAAPDSCTTTFTVPLTGYTTQLDPVRIRFASRAYAGNGGNTLDIVDGAVDDAAASPVIDITP
jgi:hypothetical protein